MPYGLSKDIGGDTPELDAKMARCIAEVMAKDPKLSKQSVIRICKASIEDAERNRARAAR